MVYIDNMYESPIGQFGRMKMSHMIADSTEELLGMADKIGVARKWIQYPGTNREHFDVCMSKRKKAIEFGAKEITWRELGEIILNKKNMIKTITRLSSHTYELPYFEVSKDGLQWAGSQEISFCKGSKDAPVHPGFIAETLIRLCVEHLESVNEIVPSDHTTGMIAHLRTALEIADERIKDREARGVLQTYQK